MKAPLLPRTDATDSSVALDQGASNEAKFANVAGNSAVAATPAPAASGWDPYEVWRTRVFAVQPAGYNRGRGNT